MAHAGRSWLLLKWLGWLLGGPLWRCCCNSNIVSSIDRLGCDASSAVDAVACVPQDVDAAAWVPPEVAASCVPQPVLNRHFRTSSTSRQC
ncbi:MAG: hypothetical protein GY938_07380 [Ketobacter sp.]|nr:hypothetical protein [Ketobacter sp.]